MIDIIGELLTWFFWIMLIGLSILFGVPLLIYLVVRSATSAWFSAKRESIDK